MWDRNWLTKRRRKGLVGGGNSTSQGFGWGGWDRQETIKSTLLKEWQSLWEQGRWREWGEDGEKQWRLVEPGSQEPRRPGKRFCLSLNSQGNIGKGFSREVTWSVHYFFLMSLRLLSAVQTGSQETSWDRAAAEVRRWQLGTMCGGHCLPRQPKPCPACILFPFPNLLSVIPTLARPVCSCHPHKSFLFFLPPLFLFLFVS